MKRHRFKVEDLSSDLIEISGGEAHHALSVLRCKRGDEVLLFDGNGAEATAAIEKVSDSQFSARIMNRSATSARQASLTIATAIPKGERADWMIEKCAELGVSRIIPLLTDRSQVNPGEGKLSRWRKKAEAAAKQSGQTTLMQIDAPMGLMDLLAADSVTPKIFGDPTSSQFLHTWLTTRTAGAPWMCLVGPEGGFSPAELASIAGAGVLGVRLGAGTLRIETAALAVAAIAHAMGT